MKRKLRTIPFFVLLLPAFFVLHGYAANSEYFVFSHTLPLFGSLLLATCLVFLIFRILLKDARKAGLMTLYCMSFFLFFGAVFDFIKAYSPWKFFYKYSVLCTGFLLTAIILFIRLRKIKTDPVRAVFFFNILFALFILLDLCSLLMKQPWKRVNHSLSATATSNNNVRPDIFVLLFDEYASSLSLKQHYHFDNSATDSFLVGQGFHLLPNSKSNYPNTVPSLASCLNMDYLPPVRTDRPVSREDVQRWSDMIRNNEVMAFLSKKGYEIRNHSFFDFKGHPAPVSQRWFSTDTKLITEETLLSRICVEFGWFIRQYEFLRKILPVTSYKEQEQNNDKCIAGVMKESQERSNTPRFVYGHFLIPHFPYYKDKNGNSRPDSIVNAVHLEQLPPLPYYLEYVQYANIELRKIVSSIRRNNPDAIIIFMSDHGYRWHIRDLREVYYAQNAIYLPSGDYSKFYDSVTHVNQFRVIFNTMFGDKFPLLKDSTVFLEDDFGFH
ncbi:MAG TPA: sulfatase-like hydrolase/transferase [Pseudobacter sp.]|nr:sulfatase-like hydrolase/transferase [Pseudobacter sp.]